MSIRRLYWIALWGLLAAVCPGGPANRAARGEDGPQRAYENRLTPVADAGPLLADHPEFVEPVRETRRYEAPLLVDDADADLHVRAWRFSYNARGIVEMPNRLSAAHTAVIMVHPWGIDDGGGCARPSRPERPISARPRRTTWPPDTRAK